MLSYRRMCSSSCFTASTYCDTWSCSFRAEAVVSLSFSAKTFIKCWTQRSEFRYFSSISCSCKVTERIHSCQVSFYTEGSAAAQGFTQISAHTFCPKNCNGIKYPQSFASTTNEHKLYYFLFFYSSLSHPSTDFLEHGSKHWHGHSKAFEDLWWCCLYSFCLPLHESMNWHAFIPKEGRCLGSVRGKCSPGKPHYKMCLQKLLIRLRSHEK